MSGKPKDDPSPTTLYHRKWRGRTAEQDPEWLERERARCRETMRRWRRVNPRGALNAQLKALFGITLEQREEMEQAQQGLCAICGQRETKVLRGAVTNLSVDHCHETGKVRGLLCNNCNNGLGRFHDDPETLAKAAAYLRRHGK